MEYKCPICEREPGSHSLKKIHSQNEVIVYYTCPAEASKYYDNEGICNHYDGEFSTIPENNLWMWVFDCSGFEFKHVCEYQVGLDLANLITKKYSDNLQKICIINPNWYIYLLLSIMWPLMDDKIKSKILYDPNFKFVFQDVPVK